MNEKLILTPCNMACVISFLLAQNHYAVQHIDQQLSNVSFCVIRVGSPFPFLSPVDKTTIVLNGSLRRALTRRLHRASVLRGVNKIIFFHFAPHHRLPLPPRTQRRQASKFLSLRCDQRFLWLCTFIFSPSTECFLFLLPREPTYLGVDDTASQERIASLWVHDVCPTGNRFSTVGRRPVGRKASKRTESGNERVLLVVLNAHPHRYLSLFNDKTNWFTQILSISRCYQSKGWVSLLVWGVSIQITVRTGPKCVVGERWVILLSLLGHTGRVATY